MEESRRRYADFSNPVFTAVAFYLTTKTYKVFHLIEQELVITLIAYRNLLVSYLNAIHLLQWAIDRKKLTALALTSTENFQQV